MRDAKDGGNTWETVMILLVFSKWALWSRKEENSMFKRNRTKEERFSHKIFIPEHPRENLNG